MDFNILTFYGNNYGAILQAFALQEYLKKNGYNVGVFQYRKSGAGVSTRRSLKSSIITTLAKFNKNGESTVEKSRKFEDFRKENLNLNENSNSKVFLAGSDQVWNPARLIDPMYFLDLFDDRSVKASYAASMGVDKIPEHKKEVIKSYLEKLDRISVREEEAKNSLSEIFDGDISVNLDPTLLHDKSFYAQFEAAPKNVPEKYILAYILHVPKNLNRLLSWLKKETGCKVVLIADSTAKEMLIQHDVGMMGAGPREFLWLVSHAEAVVSTSFHGTCFSLIYEKEFYSIVNSAAPSRITNLLGKFDLSPLGGNDSGFVRNNHIDWDTIRQKIREEENKSRAYLRGVYALAEEKNKRTVHGDVRSVGEKCIGCAACAHVCPVQAITMKLNRRGFCEPHINADQCISCGKCLRMCPTSSKLVIPKQKAYYGWSTDSEIIRGSSSGGVFRCLADSVLAENGVVVSAIYSEDWKSVIFADSDSVSVEKMQKSKYTFSNPDGAYRKIDTFLKQGRKVFFCGTPCQCAAVYSIFGKDCKNLLTCDFVCGGMASLAFYREHMEWLEARYNSSITSVDFRPKEWGWGQHRIKVQFENGKTYVRKSFLDSYFSLFVEKKVSVNQACYCCAFRHYHRSDITIADFWGYQKLGIEKHGEGLSMIVANTQKGVSAVEAMKKFELHEMDEKYVRYAFMPKAPVQSKVAENNRFFALAEEKGFETAATALYDFNPVHVYAKKIKRKLGLK